MNGEQQLHSSHYQGGFHNKFDNDSTNSFPYHHSDRNQMERLPFKGESQQPMETKLLPNELRISSQGNMKMYADTSFQLFNKGFNHLKIVGRGRAVPLTKDLVDYLREKSSTFFYF